MERVDKTSQLQNINRETELHDILLDLLPMMGYCDVTLTHERGNNPELGKDIVASKLDEIENRKEWTAFVIKIGDVRGTSIGTQEIKAQVEECFAFPWNSISKGKDNRINKVKVVTNGKYNSGAKDKILKDEFYNNPNISLWGNIELVEFIDKFYPRFWLKGSKVYKHYIEVFQKKNKEDDLSKTFGISNVKIKKILDYAIKPKLLELRITDNSELKRKWFELHDVAKLNECTLIVGHSGSGKSTFFKQLANDIIYENSLRNDYEYYPFILRFVDFIECNFNIIDVLSRNLQTGELKEINIDDKELLIKKNFVLFIDSLDELSALELKQKALSSISDFHKEYPEIKIYFSSRPADSLLTHCQKLNFKYLEISNVSTQQAEQFLGRYFDDEQIKCKRLLKSLRDSRILDKLPRTPITLALIAAIFDENEVEIPATISDLYKYFVDILLNKSFIDSTLDLLKISIHRSVLSYLATYLHENRAVLIQKNELFVLLSKFADERGHKYNVNQLIDDLIQSVGLLIENERTEVQFKHLSFQEYFTAYQIYNHEPNKKSLFIENFNDIWWQNVGIFYAGMTKDSPELLNEILANSLPKNFQEYVINMSGIGYVMQALYNTPISTRNEGVKRNIENANNAVNFILTTTAPEYNVLKFFLNTKYGAYKIISLWFEFHHASITLKEPLEQAFNRLITEIADPNISPQDRFLNEYSAFLIASTLSEIGDYNIGFMQELLAVTDTKNYYVLGLINSNFTDHSKSFSREQKVRNDVKKLKRRLDLIDGEKLMNGVNISLTDGKIVKKNINYTKKQK